MSQPSSNNIPLSDLSPDIGPSGIDTQAVQTIGDQIVHQPIAGSEVPSTPTPDVDDQVNPSDQESHVPDAGVTATPATLSMNQNPQSQPPTGHNLTSPPPFPQTSTSSAVNGNHPNNVPTQTNGATLASTPPPPIQRKKRKTFLSICWSMKGPLSLIAVYSITTYIISTSSDINGLLARSGVMGGFLLLNILALLNNYALLAAGDKAWETVQWSRSFMRDGQNLTDFLALSTSSGISGWLGIVFHDLRLLKRVWTRLTGIVPWPRAVVGRAAAGNQPQTRKSSISKARFWGLGRVGFWLLVQFPGLIFMTKVNPGVNYRPTEWEDIGGGIGKYNASLAALKTADGAYLSGLALNMIRDVTMTKESQAISQECTAKTNCTSYIIPGGLKTVSPWRYFTENGSTLPVYMTRDTPVYQLDFWDEPYVQWAEKDCTLFGMYGASGIADSAFQICMTPYNEGKILAAFKHCNEDVTADGGCTYQDSWRRAATWNVIVAMYRRMATVSIDRRTGEILDMKNLTKAEPQEITPADYLTAFDGMLYPFKKLDISFACDEDGGQFQLTKWISTVLLFSKTALYQREPREILRNLFMVPLYFYNPMTSPFGPLPSVTEKAQGLPSENNILGSFSHKVDLLTISWWTVLTYIISCGILLFLILLVLAVTAWNQVQETSNYPLVDFLTLKKATAGTTPNRSGANAGSQDDVATVFANCTNGGSRDILEASRGVRIIGREEAKLRASTHAPAQNIIDKNMDPGEKLVKITNPECLNTHSLKLAISAAESPDRPSGGTIVETMTTTSAAKRLQNMSWLKIKIVLSVDFACFAAWYEAVKVPLRADRTRGLQF
ncbi:hypothetical protein VTL71DRAFT_10131 [Oculimacula yallundae]|uniref:Uncharacterized protein n=1 Tax=Oculimacula yallundae TaxID=86028 RepID=A0ABR4BQJ1_9HELO